MRQQRSRRRSAPLPGQGMVLAAPKWGGEGCGGSFSVTWQFWELARSRCFRIRRCDDVAPSRNLQVLLSLRARGRRPFTQHTHWQGTLLECGSRPPLACTTTRALRSGSDGVARWWRRHDDEQEAGPVSAALLNAFLNSADFFCRAYMWSNRAIAGSLGRRLRSCSRLGW